MNETPSHLRALHRIEIPPHLQTFTDESIHLLETAHASALELPNTSLRTSFDNNTYRTYIERRNLVMPRDYEFIAVHLGQSSLMVCMEHRHDTVETYDGASDRAFARSTVAIQNGGAKIYHSRITRMWPEEDITENETAGHEMTSRLYHSFGVIGIQQLLGTEQRYEQAS